MKTEVIEVSPTRKELKIEIEGDLIKPVYAKVSQKYAKFAQIPGFRKGNAPLDVIKMRFREEIQNDVLREILPERVTQAIQDSNLNPIGEPEIHLDDNENIKLNGSKPLSLRVHIEIFPEIEKLEYKGLEATRRVRPVSDEEIERFIEDRRKHGAAFVPVENRKSKKGDTLIVDLTGTIVDDSISEPFKLDDIEIELGGENTLEAFSENLSGIEQDSAKTFFCDYPSDFSTPELAGKKVEYTVSVKSIGKIELPEADDEWAQGLDENYKTIADLRRKLRDDLELVAKMESDNRLRDELLAKLIEKYPVEVPSRLIDMQARSLLNNFARDLQGRGMDPKQINEDFLKMAYQSMSIQAERDVRGALLLDKIAALEKIEVKPEEIEAEIANMARHYSVSPEEMKKTLADQGGDRGISERLQSRKAVDTLLAKAKIADGEWVDPNQAPEDAPKEEKKAKSKAKKAKSKE